MNHILQNWEECISQNRLPLFEIELANEEWLLVHLDVTDTEITFEFDAEHGEPRFDEEIIGEKGCYSITYDAEHDTLDSLLEMVMENINEGYIAVYGLYPTIE